MKALVALLLTTVALAGCSGGEHALDPYMMDAFDAPDACYYIDIEEGQWQQVAAIAGLKSNPGSVADHMLSLGGVTPKDNRFAAMECRFGGEPSQYVSAALKFTDADAAKRWIAAAQSEALPFLEGARCVPQALVFTDGAVIGLIGVADSEWHPQFQQAAQQRFAQILDETGAKDYCA